MLSHIFKTYLFTIYYNAPQISLYAEKHMARREKKSVHRLPNPYAGDKIPPKSRDLL